MSKYITETTVEDVKHVVDGGATGIKDIIRKGNGSPLIRHQEKMHLGSTSVNILLANKKIYEIESAKEIGAMEEETRGTGADDEMVRKALDDNKRLEIFPFLDLPLGKYTLAFFYIQLLI